MKVDISASGKAIFNGTQWVQETSSTSGICMLSNRAFDPGERVYRPVQEGTDHTLRILASELTLLALGNR
jgi:hypothetical protein